MEGDLTRIADGLVVDHRIKTFPFHQPAWHTTHCQDNRNRRLIFVEAEKTGNYQKFRAYSDVKEQQLHKKGLCCACGECRALKIMLSLVCRWQAMKNRCSAKRFCELALRAARQPEDSAD